MTAHIISVVFGCLSAVLWIGSSAVPMPHRVWIVARVGGGGPSDDVDLLVKRLRLQSRLSGAAALGAAVAMVAPILADYL
jgi:hypothetical protein